MTPLHVDLTGSDVSASRRLGAATDALLGSVSTTILIDFGGNAVNPKVLGVFMSWRDRNAHLFRSRLRAMACVAPSWWTRVQWRAALALDPPPVPTAVFGSPRAAHDWLARRGPADSRRVVTSAPTRGRSPVH